MRVTKRRGVGNHDAGIAVPPESPLIRPTDTRNERWKSGGLFIHKGDEPERVLCRSSGEPARQREHRSDAAAVVVCAGRTEDRVVVRADEHNLGANTGNFRLDVVTSLALQFVTVAPGM